MTDTSHAGRHRRSRRVPGPNSDDRSRAGQTLLNEDWPPPAIARRLKNAAAPIEVEARLVFDRDGEAWLPGHALRWTKMHVMVEIIDPRLQVSRVWLAPHDLHRAASHHRAPKG